MALFHKRDELKDFLIKNQIEVKIHYPVPLHRQKAHKFKISKSDFPISDYQSKKLLTIPVHQFLSKKQLSYVVQKIKSFY